MSYGLSMGPCTLAHAPDFFEPFLRACEKKRRGKGCFLLDNFSFSSMQCLNHFFFYIFFFFKSCKRFFFFFVLFLTLFLFIAFSFVEDGSLHSAGKSKNKTRRTSQPGASPNQNLKFLSAMFVIHFVHPLIVLMDFGVRNHSVITSFPYTSAT